PGSVAADTPSSWPIDSQHLQWKKELLATFSRQRPKTLARETCLRVEGPAHKRLGQRVPAPAALPAPSPGPRPRPPTRPCSSATPRAEFVPTLVPRGTATDRGRSGPARA